MTEYYSEIENLKLFKKRHNISIEVDKTKKIDRQLTPVKLKIENTEYMIHSEDEYFDLKIDNELLHLEIILRELETLNISTDFLDWCKLLNLNASNEKLLTYYKEIINQLSDFKNLFDNGKLTTFINDLDFQLNAGAIQILRLNKNRT